MMRQKLVRSKVFPDARYLQVLRRAKKMGKLRVVLGYFTLYIEATRKKSTAAL